MRLKRWDDDTGSSQGYWLVKDTPGLAVYKTAKGKWHLAVRPSYHKDFHVLDPDPQLVEILAEVDPERAKPLRWLIEVNLAGKPFPTRQAALSALGEALESFPEAEVS